MASAARENSRIIIQSDWQLSFREPEGKAWVSYKKPGHPSIHGELLCHGLSSDGTPYVTASDGFQVDKISRRTIEVSYEDSVTQYQCKFQAPCDVFSSVHQSRVSCLDVTSGGLGVSSDTQGQLCLWTTNSGDVRRRLEGHYGDIYTCRFFPSGVVVLSGGADCQLKIWSAESGQCAATLVGHKSGIMDTAIVEKGRNIVSVSRDGTAKLWDCGQSQCLTTFEDTGGSINACAVGAVSQDISLGNSSLEHSEREVLTEGKMLLLALETGMFQGHGLHSREKMFDISCGSAVNCCTFVADNLVACGCQDGRLFLFDLRNTECPLQKIQESRSAILSLLPHQQGVFVSTGDGSCFYMTETFQTELELTGSDCDPIYSIASDGSYIYTACRDTNISKYSLQL